MVIGYIEYKRVEDIDKLNYSDLMGMIKGEKKAELYNKISNILFYDLGLSSAELDLICTYVIAKYMGEV